MSRPSWAQARKELSGGGLLGLSGGWMPSALERSFAFALKSVDVDMVQQYKFHPTRRWRLDFADVDTKTALEIDGGEFINGAHSRGARMANDYEKRNAATEMGWACFQLTGAQVRKNPVGWARRIGEVIESRRDV